MLKFDIKSKRFIDAELSKDDGGITALYARLSKEDDKEGESGSIANQRDFLLGYALECGFKNIWFFADDGYSGTTLDRPQIQAILELMKQGRVANLLVKDHSRLGRNRLKVGELTEQFTNEYEVRYIAVSDNIDTAKGLDDMVMFRELFNEFYPRDTSKKIRSTFKNKGESGERLCTRVPYGYNGDKHSWEIDPVAAKVVKKIFALAIGGLGPSQIANRLSAEGRLNPTAYRLAQGIKTHNPPPADSTVWNAGTISQILERMEYTGCTVNFKTKKLSFKSPKEIKLPREKWKIFPNTQPAIIDQETYDRVQELRQNRRHPTKTGRLSIFSGLTFCADCGSKMYYGTRKDYDRTQDNFRCGNYKASAESCTSHYIREVVLYDFVLAHLRQTIEYVKNHQNEFVQAKLEQSVGEQKRQTAQKRKELTQANHRMGEMTNIFKKLYEDNISGKLNDNIFNHILVEYEKERDALQEKIAALSVEETATVSVDKIVNLVRKCVDIEELNATLLNEFIKRIDVYAIEKSGGHWRQRIDLVYNVLPNGILPEIRKTIHKTIYTVTGRFAANATETAVAKMRRIILNVPIENQGRLYNDEI